MKEWQLLGKIYLSPKLTNIKLFVKKLNYTLLAQKEEGK